MFQEVARWELLACRSLKGKMTFGQGTRGGQNNETKGGRYIVDLEFCFS